MRFLFTFLALAFATRAAEQRQTNILFLFADDERWDTLSCAGHDIVRTPTIDHLAEQGVRFSNAHVTTAVCWVSRAVVLTGQWALSHADPRAVPTVKLESLNTVFPEVLRGAGYRTGQVGEWHMITPPGFKPEERYDVYDAVTRNPDLKTMPDGTKKHETDIVCDKGIAFIKSQSKQE